MTKSEVIEALAEDINIEINEARDIVNTVLTSMSSALIQGNDIQLRGFGTFKIRKYNSYIGHNPKTGVKTTVKPKKLPFFKPGKHLAQAVNEARNE